jgi:hypothetical protein
MSAESGALLEQLDRKNRMFLQLAQMLGDIETTQGLSCLAMSCLALSCLALSCLVFNCLFFCVVSFSLVLACVVSTEQWKAKLVEHDSRKSELCLLQQEVLHSKTHSESLEKERNGLSEDLRTKEANLQHLQTTMEQDRLQFQEQTNLDEVRVKVMTEQLHAYHSHTQNAEKDMELVRQAALESTAKLRESEVRCQRTDNKLAAANAMIRKLETMGVEETKQLQNANQELLGKLSKSRETLALFEHKQESAQKANSALLHQLKVKVEQGNVLLERCENMEEEHSKALLHIQRTVDTGQALLATEKANALAAKAANVVVVESLLANMAEKMEAINGKEREMLVLERQWTSALKDNGFLQADIDSIRFYFFDL